MNSVCVEMKITEGFVYSVWCGYKRRFLFWNCSNHVVNGILSYIKPVLWDYMLSVYYDCFGKKTHSHLTSWDSHPTTNLLAACREWLLLPGAPHHFSHFHPSGEKGNLCIILKPIVAYLVGREHVFPTGSVFVCGSASFKFSFIPVLLPTLWPIISCNIGHPRLCEAPAPFAFLIQM